MRGDRGGVGRSGNQIYRTRPVAGTVHRMARICAVLVDVGGTLWPDRWPAHPGDGAQRRDRLRAAFPGLGPEQAAACAAELDQAGAQLPGTLTQDPGSFIRPALRRYGLGGGPDQVAAALQTIFCKLFNSWQFFFGKLGNIFCNWLTIFVKICVEIRGLIIFPLKFFELQSVFSEFYRANLG